MYDQVYQTHAPISISINVNHIRNYEINGKLSKNTSDLYVLKILWKLSAYLKNNGQGFMISWQNTLFDFEKPDDLACMANFVFNIKVMIGTR